MESANKMKLTYTNVNGYLIPNLTYKSGEQMEQLGKYGFLRRDYLKNHRNSLYQVMLLQDSIGEHLLEVDKNSIRGEICPHDPITFYQAPPPTLGITIQHEIW